MVDFVMMIIMSMVYAVFMVFDFILIYRGKSRKLIWFYLSLMTCSYLIIMLIGLGIKIPSPAPVIKSVVTSIMMGGKK